MRITQNGGRLVKYRLLSLMLTLSIVTGMCPVFAAEGNGAEQQRAYRKTDAGTIWSGYDKDGVTAKPIPATVQLVSATAGSGSVTVKWNAVSGANGYNIYRKTAGGGWKKVKTVGSSTTSWKDTGLKKRTAYTDTVRAYRTVDGTKVLGGYDKTGVTAAAK